MAKSDPALRKQLADALNLLGGAVTYRSMRDLRHKLDVNASNTQLKKAVNSSVWRGDLIASKVRTTEGTLITVCLPTCRPV